MKKKLSNALALLLLLAHASPAVTRAQTPRQEPAAAPPAQQPTPQPSPSEDADEDVVRITSNLVQFDAVVTDKQGRLVTDLRPEEFEVFVGGRRQEITNFSFVLNETTPAADGQPAKPAAAADKTAPPLPPVPLRPSQVRRTIALVVDDLGTSFEDIVYVRRALKKFVDEQMQPGDLVAVMRTSAGVGALQQFTTDRRLLYRAIERVRWNPQGRAGVSAFAPLDLTTTAYTEANPAGGSTPSRPSSAAADRELGQKENPAADLEEFRRGVFTVGTLGALNFIIRGMNELPGRKSILVFSDGFKIYPKPGTHENTTNVIEALRRLTDQANRASVVIYTVDARGLPCLCITAADNLGPRVSPAVITQAMDERSEEFLAKKEGLAFLADQTGGLFINNTNDLGGGVRRVLDDQKGYYLIGFRPGDGLFDTEKGRPRFNKFEVKVRRAGLNVRTRAGFYGYTDRELKAAVPHTRSEQLISAIASPLTSGDLSLRLTSLFNSPAGDAQVVNSLMHIDMSQFKFVDEPDGWKKAVVDVVAITFGENGQVIDEVNRTETLRARGDGFEQLMRNGLVYLMKVPVKKPGAYQLRVAVRDAAAERLGSASQFIEVPDLRKNRLALSGLFMMDAAKSEAAAKADAQGGAADNLRDATLRRFRAGSTVDFFYDIYNARADRATGRPQLQTQSRIFRDGQLVFTGPLQPYDPGAQPDTRHLPAASRIQLGAQMTPGEYVLQVVVTDLLAKDKYRTTTQWIDFEIVK